MAVRKARFRLPSRIAGVLGNQTAAAAERKPVPTATSAPPVTGSAASPGGTPQAMPLTRVIVQPTSSQYVTLGSDELEPIWTADGAGIPATSYGSWGQVVPAGNPHPRHQRPVRAPIAGSSAQRGPRY